MSDLISVDIPSRMTGRVGDETTDDLSEYVERITKGEFSEHGKWRRVSKRGTQFMAEINPRKSYLRDVRKTPVEVRYDTNFHQVLEGCVNRPNCNISESLR